MKRLAIAAIAVLGAIHWITTAAVADGKQVLQYVETIPSGEVGGWTVGRHRVTQVPPGGHYFVQHDWADPPREIGPEGFRLELAIGGWTKGGSIYAGTGAVGGAFTFEPETGGIDMTITSGSLTTQLGAVQVIPKRGLTDGSIVELKVGAYYGPGTIFRYRVSSGDGGGKPNNPGDGETAAASTYLGCYKDPNNPFDLDGYLERSAQNTPQRCVGICAERGFRYAGVQYSESCLCGQSYGRFGPADNCTMACTGDPGQICGGMNSNSVFATGR